MLEEAIPEPVLRRRLRWVLSRGLMLLGGVVAGTAAVWALSSATASADPLSSPSLPDVGHAVHGAVSDVVPDVDNTAENASADDTAASADEKVAAATENDDDATPVERIGSQVVSSGEDLTAVAKNTVDTTVHAATSVLHDPKGSAKEAASDAAAGARKTFGGLASGWHDLTDRFSGDWSQHGGLHGAIGTAVHRIAGNHAGSLVAANGDSYPQTPEPAQAVRDTAAPAPADVPAAAGTEMLPAGSPYAVVQDLSGASAHSAERGQGPPQCPPQSPTRQPLEPAAVPSGSSSSGQCNTGGGTGVAVTTLGDFVDPGLSIHRNARSGFRAPSGQPGRQPGCTPD